MSNERLHLSTGPDCYTKFCLVLQGSLRIAWQTILAARQNKTTDSFDEDVRALINEYYAPSARDDQLEYMRSAFKPYGMTVEALAARIKVIS
jgi:hypothetical protein